MSTTHCSGSQWRVVSWCGPSQCAHASGSIVTIKDALATILSWSTYVICIAFCFVLAERFYTHIQYRVCYPLEKTSGEWRFLYDRAARPASIEIYVLHLDLGWVCWHSFSYVRIINYGDVSDVDVQTTQSRTPTLCNICMAWDQVTC